MLCTFRSLCAKGMAVIWFACKDLQLKKSFTTCAGHGSDENQCAEFCVTSHCFKVNGAKHWVNFTQAGTPWGCTKTVLLLLLPSLHAGHISYCLRLPRTPHAR